MGIADAVKGTSATYQVFYLVRGVKTPFAKGLSLSQAQQELNGLKRRGMTGWVADEAGKFVPVPGAKREPPSL